jgi:hypothetical protein
VLGACGGAQDPGVVELHNTVPVSASLPRDGTWRHFYFECIQATPCGIDIQVNLADPTLAARLTQAVQAQPMGAVIKTSQMLLYSNDHSIDYRFEQGLKTDLGNGAVETVNSVALTSEPNNARYDVSLAYPEIGGDAAAAKLLPDTLPVTLAVSWR